MTQPTYHIARNEALPQAQSHEELMRHAIGLIEKHAGDVWTHYNPSDPGITLLQSLAYAVVELALKADLPIEDLLTPENGQPDYSGPLAPPEEVLSTNPITIEDFRRLLLQHMPPLQDVQLWPQPNPAHNIPTMAVQLWPRLHPITGAPDTTMEEPIAATLQAQACQLLRQHGLSGQHYAYPTLGTAQPLALAGTIYLTPDANPEAHAAHLLLHLNRWLAPTWQPHAAPNNPNNPNNPSNALHNNLHNNLPSPPAQLNAQVLETQLYTLPGTGAISGLAIEGLAANTPRTPYYSITWESLAHLQWQQQQSRYSTHPNTSAHMGQCQGIDQNQVALHLQHLQAAQPAPSATTTALPQGQHRGVAQYHSIQHHMPNAYNLGHHTLPAYLPKAQQGKVKQLKGYLALMEQAMADFLAQAANLRQLFSYQSGRSATQTTHPTYATQAIDTLPGMAALLGEDLPEDLPESESLAGSHYQQVLATGQETTTVQQNRKRRMLEHLMARVGLSYSAESLQRVNPTFGNSTPGQIWHSSQRLQNFAALSHNRLRTYHLLPAETAAQSQEHPHQKGEAPAEHLANGAQWLAAGVARSIDDELDLRGYLQGILDLVASPHSQKQQQSSQLLWQENGRTLLKAPLHATAQEVTESIATQLQQLTTQFRGMVWLEAAPLCEWAQANAKASGEQATTQTPTQLMAILPHYLNELSQSGYKAYMQQRFAQAAPLGQTVQLHFEEDTQQMGQLLAWATQWKRGLALVYRHTHRYMQLAPAQLHPALTQPEHTILTSARQAAGQLWQYLNKTAP